MSLWGEFVFRNVSLMNSDSDSAPSV